MVRAGGGAIGVVSDRLLNCARCQQQLRVCRRCDDGQRYCPDPCARQAHRACVQAAGQRYQQTLRGRLHHARRQHLWCQRHCEKVTHHGFTSRCDSANVGSHEQVDDNAQAIAKDAPELGGRIEIVEFDPPCDMAWMSVAGIDHRGRWRLRPRERDRTGVELRVIYHVPGGILSYLVDLVAAPVLKGHLQRSLAALKQQVEVLPRSTAKRSVLTRRARRAGGQPLSRKPLRAVQ